MFPSPAGPSSKRRSAHHDRRQCSANRSWSRNKKAEPRLLTTVLSAADVWTKRQALASPIPVDPQRKHGSRGLGAVNAPRQKRGETQRIGRGNGLQPCPVVTTRLVEASANRLAGAFLITYLHDFNPISRGDSPVKLACRLVKKWVQTRIVKITCMY